MARFLLGLLASCAAVAAAMADSTNAVPCARYPRICSSRSVAHVLAHSREDWNVRRVPDASCRSTADATACGRIDHTRNEHSRVLQARGANAVSDIADVLLELPSAQFVGDCSVLSQCQGRVGSLMDLIGAHPHPDVARALRRWLDLESAPLGLRVEAALQLLRSGQIHVLPKLVALLCAGGEAGEGSSERARIPPVAREAVPYLRGIVSKPGAGSCTKSVSLEILLSIDSVFAIEALEQLGRSKDPEQRAIVYRQLKVQWDRAPRRTVEVLQRLALDGPEPERACFSLQRVQELRLGRSANELYRFCQATPGTAEWRATTNELATLEREREEAAVRPAP
jgi:hypothetical protein